jgi:hypothetical protein
MRTPNTAAGGAQNGDGRSLAECKPGAQMVDTDNRLLALSLIMLRDGAAATAEPVSALIADRPPRETLKTNVKY